MLRERSENGAKHEVPPQSGEARREYEYPIPFRRVGYHHVGDSSDELSVLNYTPIGVGALCALGASHCVCPHGKPPRSNLRHSP